MSTRRTPRSTFSTDRFGGSARSRRPRRSAGVVALVVIAVAVVLGLVVAGRHGTSSAAGPGGRPSTPTSVPTRTSRPTAHPGTLRPERGLTVASTTLDLVDATRPVTGAGGTIVAARALPTVLWTPAGAGPYPLVVFVHGYDTGPADYARFASALASAGYVVAAPSFPQEDPARGVPLDRSHLADEAGDVAFVVRTLEQRAAGLRLAAGKVAVVGHSDGADVALLVGYGPGTADPGVAAVVADAPDPMTSTPVASPAPLLLIQGTADPVVPYSASASVFAQVRAPVAYLSLVGADHLGPIAGGTPWSPLLDDAVARFLDAAVAGRGTATPLAALVATPPLTTLATRA
jgi:fermentation-respiration switch protein FrsA (DUF1100 family)